MPAWGSVRASNRFGNIETLKITYASEVGNYVVGDARALVLNCILKSLAQGVVEKVGLIHYGDIFGV